MTGVEGGGGGGGGRASGREEVREKEEEEGHTGAPCRAFKSTLGARERDFICLCICPRWKREFTFGKQTLLTKLRQRTHRRAKPIARKNHFRTSIELSFCLPFSFSVSLSFCFTPFYSLSLFLTYYLSISQQYNSRDNIDALLKFSPFHRFDSNLPRS